MEAPIPIITPINEKDSNNINFIEHLIIKKESKEYKIEFGLNIFAKEEMILRITSNDSKKIFYYQKKANLKELQDLSKIFTFYENIKEIISFLKTLKYEINEKNDDLELTFSVFLPNGQTKLILLNLKKYYSDDKNIISYLLEENKLLKNEILLLKENNKTLLNENKKLWNEINEIKESIRSMNQYINLNSSFDSKIINSINEINFILNYIKYNDKSFSFNSLHLLYRASRDGDRTETCHKLCDNKKNVLIIIKSDTGYIFGGYCKIGFKVNPKNEYKIDNNCFLFSYNLKKIYPVIKDKKVICYIKSNCGLCFSGSLSFYDNFLRNSYSYINGGETSFTGFSEYFEMNGGKREYIIKELEVFQLNEINL